MSASLLSLVSVLFVSLVSIVAVLPLLSRLQRLPSLTPFLVSLAVGALLGDTFFHLLPASSSFNFVLVGFMGFFVLEKLIRWRHCHYFDCHDDDHSPVIVHLSVIGDLVHNFLDGLAIAASFHLSPSLGLATSIAVLLHEIPQEIGDFGIYLHAGFSLKKALILNLLSSLTAFLAVFVYFSLTPSLDFSSWLIPATAGGFLYLASSDLIPELHRHDSRLSSSLSQLLGILLGLSLMYLLTFLE